MVAYLSGVAETCKPIDSSDVLENPLTHLGHISKNAIATHPGLWILLENVHLHDRPILLLQLHDVDLPAQDLLHLLHQQNPNCWVFVQVHHGNAAQRDPEKLKRNQTRKEEEEEDLKF